MKTNGKYFIFNSKSIIPKKYYQIFSELQFQRLLWFGIKEESQYRAA